MKSMRWVQQSLEVSLQMASQMEQLVVVRQAEVPVKQWQEPALQALPPHVD